MFRALLNLGRRNLVIELKQSNKRAKFKFYLLFKHNAFLALIGGRFFLVTHPLERLLFMALLNLELGGGKTQSWSWNYLVSYQSVFFYLLFKNEEYENLFRALLKLGRINLVTELKQSNKRAKSLILPHFQTQQISKLNRWKVFFWLCIPWYKFLQNQTFCSNSSLTNGVFFFERISYGASFMALESLPKVGDVKVAEHSRSQRFKRTFF